MTSYDIVRKPVITEKSMTAMADKKYTFIVHITANKVQVKKAVEEIEEVTGKQYKELLIVGGGSNAEFLNEITAKETGKVVYSGPDEATAIGNLLVQMISSKEIKDLKEGRKKVKESFKVKVYKGEK